MTDPHSIEDFQAFNNHLRKLHERGADEQTRKTVEDIWQINDELIQRLFDPNNQPKTRFLHSEQMSSPSPDVQR